MYSSMNKIMDCLYLGSLDAANDTISLKRNGITHILTVAVGLEPANKKVHSLNLGVNLI